MKQSIKINQIFFFLLVIIVSVSCNSDDDMDDDNINVEYFVKAKVDGVAVEYKNKAALDGAIWTNDGFYNLDMFGGILEGGQSVTSESITINLLKQSSQITETNYSGYGVTEGVLKGVLIIYSFDIQDIVYSTDITNPVSSLTITEITTTHIKGTFSGVVRDFLNDDTKTISDGEFFVPRSN